MQPELNEDLLREQNRAVFISVKVSVEKLTVNGSYQIDRRVVTSMVKHFNSGTFDRLDSRSHLPALIAPHTLPQHLYNYVEDDLQGPPDFDPVDLIACLRGREELEAAKICNTSTGGW